MHAAHACVCVWLRLCVHVTTIIERALSFQPAAKTKMHKCILCLVGRRYGGTWGNKVAFMGIYPFILWLSQCKGPSLCVHVCVCEHRQTRSREMLVNLKCDGFGRSLLQEGAQDMEKRGWGGVERWAAQFIKPLCWGRLINCLCDCFSTERT